MESNRSSRGGIRDPAPIMGNSFRKARLRTAQGQDPYGHSLFTSMKKRANRNLSTSIVEDKNRRFADMDGGDEKAVNITVDQGQVPDIFNKDKRHAFPFVNSNVSTKVLRQNQSHYRDQLTRIRMMQIESFRQTQQMLRESRNKTLKMPPIRVVKSTSPIPARKHRAINHFLGDEEHERKPSLSNKLSVLIKRKYIGVWNLVDTVPTCRPSVGEGASLAWAMNRVFLFGGVSHSLHSDMYELRRDFSHWKVAPYESEPLTGRFGHSMVTWEDNKLVIFGGGQYYNVGKKKRECFNEVMVFDTESHLVSEMKSVGDEVPRRTHHACTMLGKYMLVHGGLTEDSKYLGDLLSLNLETARWKKVKQRGEIPGPTAYHSIACVLPDTIPLEKMAIARILGDFMKEDSQIKKPGIYMFGGKNSKEEPSNDLKVLVLGTDMPTWEKVQTSGETPCPRFCHSMHYFQEGNSLIVYGGRNDDNHNEWCFGDVFLLNIGTLEWSSLKINGGVPAPRYAQASIMLGSRLLVTGGINYSAYTGSDLFVLDIHQEGKQKSKSPGFYSDDLTFKKLERDRTSHTIIVPNVGSSMDIAKS